MMSVPLCSPGEARFQPIQGSITLDHSCPAPLRFHHVGWQSLGVRPRPRLAPFARHVEDIFFKQLQGSCLFIFFFQEDISSIFRISITNSYLQSPRMTHRATFQVVFCSSTTGWIHAFCFAACANSWCRGLQVQVMKACKILLLQRQQTQKKNISPTFPRVYTSKSTRKIQ